jgi:hypothetical protein
MRYESLRWIHCISAWSIPKFQPQLTIVLQEIKENSLRNAKQGKGICKISRENIEGGTLEKIR